jgi:hypothetical protein
MSAKLPHERVGAFKPKQALTAALRQQTAGRRLQFRVVGQDPDPSDIGDRCFGRDDADPYAAAQIRISTPAAG